MHRKIETFIEKSNTKKYLIETLEFRFYVGVYIEPESGDFSIKILSSESISNHKLSPGEIDEVHIKYYLKKNKTSFLIDELNTITSSNPYKKLKNNSFDFDKIERTVL